jgi:hypothetical protein
VVCTLHIFLNGFTRGRNEVVGYLAGLDDRAPRLTTRVPMQILTDIDNGRNPMHLTKDRLERAATENQFMNGKIKAIEVRLGLLHVCRVTGMTSTCLGIELPEAVGRGASADVS